MERIASFCVDHTRLDRGMYLSRQDGDVLTCVRVVALFATHSTSAHVVTSVVSVCLYTCRIKCGSAFVLAFLTVFTRTVSLKFHATGCTYTIFHIHSSFKAAG